jgi:hypothetical protein
MVKSSSAPTQQTQPSRRTVPGIPPTRPAWRPIDFDGEDTSLTQDHIALLK